jgi:hypothetical protein
VFSLRVSRVPVGCAHDASVSPYHVWHNLE